ATARDECHPPSKLRQEYSSETKEDRDRGRGFPVQCQPPPQSYSTIPWPAGNILHVSPRTFRERVRWQSLRRRDDTSTSNQRQAAESWHETRVDPWKAIASMSASSPTKGAMEAECDA